MVGFSGNGKPETGNALSRNEKRKTRNRLFPLAIHRPFWHIMGRIAMHRWLKIIAACFVLLCVLTIFVAPSVDLPDTAIRNGKLLAFILLAINAMLLCGWLPALLLFLEPRSAVALLVFDPDRSRSQRTC